MNVALSELPIFDSLPECNETVFNVVPSRFAPPLHILATRTTMHVPGVGLAIRLFQCGYLRPRMTPLRQRVVMSPVYSASISIRICPMEKAGMMKKIGLQGT